MADFSMEGADDLPDFGDPDGESDEHSPVEVPVPAAPLTDPKVPGPQRAGAAGAAAGAPPAKPPGIVAGGAAAAPAGAPASQDALPADSDNERWLEFLRDGHMRQLREEAEHPEPPPFQLAMQFAAPPGVVTPEGYYPRHALSHQLWCVRRLSGEGEGSSSHGQERWGDRWSDRSSRASERNPYGQRWGGWERQRMAPPGMVDADACAAAMLPQLLGQLQAGGVDPSVLVQVSQHAQAGQLNGILSEVAKRLAATRKAAARAARGGGDGPGGAEKPASG